MQFLALAVAGVVVEGPAAPIVRHRRAGEAFTEARAQGGRLLHVGSGVAVRFRLPPSAEPDFLQFEIPALPGQYRIELLLGGVALPDLARRVVNVRDRVLEATAPHQVRYASASHSPIVEIDVRGVDLRPEPGGGTYADIVIQREDPFALADAALDRATQELSSSFQQQMRAVSDIAFGHAQELRRHGLALQAVHDEVAIRSRGIQEQLHQVSGELATLGVAHAEAIAATTELGRDNGRRMDALGTQLVAISRQLDDLKRAAENVFWRRWLRSMRRSSR